jgi:hypothetical protein
MQKGGCITLYGCHKTAMIKPFIFFFKSLLMILSHLFPDVSVLIPFGRQDVPLTVSSCYIKIVIIICQFGNKNSYKHANIIYIDKMGCYHKNNANQLIMTSIKHHI